MSNPGSDSDGGMTVSDVETCRALIKTLTSEKYKDKNYLFLEPFDLSQTPGYMDVVTKVMDLSTLSQNLESGRYASLEAFAKDVALIFENAIAYHSSRPESKWIVKPAKDMLKVCKRLVAVMMAKGGSTPTSGILTNTTTTTTTTTTASSSSSSSSQLMTSHKLKLPTQKNKKGGGSTKLKLKFGSSAAGAAAAGPSSSSSSTGNNVSPKLSSAMSSSSTKGESPTNTNANNTTTNTTKPKVSIKLKASTTGGKQPPPSSSSLATMNAPIAVTTSAGSGSTMATATSSSSRNDTTKSMGGGECKSKKKLSIKPRLTLKLGKSSSSKSSMATPSRDNNNNNNNEEHKNDDDGGEDDKHTLADRSHSKEDGRTAEPDEAFGDPSITTTTATSGTSPKSTTTSNSNKLSIKLSNNNNNSRGKELPKGVAPPTKTTKSSSKKKASTSTAAALSSKKKVTVKKAGATKAKSAKPGESKTVTVITSSTTSHTSAATTAGGASGITASTTSSGDKESGEIKLAVGASSPKSTISVATSKSATSKASTKKKTSKIKLKQSTSTLAPASTTSQPTNRGMMLMTPMRKAQCAKVLAGLKRRNPKKIGWFLHPVADKGIIQDYRNKIKFPMDLSTMQNKLDKNEYPTIASFALDVRRIFSNCLQYNTSIRDSLRPIAVEVLEQAEELMMYFLAKPEYPTQVYPPGLFCWKLCLNVLDTLYNLTNNSDGQPTALYFLYPVSFYCGGQFPTDYLEKVPVPMDFGTVTAHLIEGQYTSADQFAADCRLVLDNCHIYYGGRDDGKVFTEQANRLAQVLNQQLDALNRYLKSTTGEQQRKAAATSVTTVTLPKPPVPLLQSVLEDLRGMKYTDKATKVSVCSKKGHVFLENQSYLSCCYDGLLD